MLQDIAPKRYHVEYTPIPPQEDSLCLIFRGGEVLETVGPDGNPALPTYGELKGNCTPCRYLFRIDKVSYYLTKLLTPSRLPEGCAWQSIRLGRAQKPKDLAFAELAAFQLARWYEANRFCGRCGAGTAADSKERMLRCPCCGNLMYPKIAPAVIVALTDGDRILMTRYRGRAYKGFALLAGFVEVGETAEDTVHREVMEEVGLRVKDLRYCGSQPWGQDDNLLLGFFARLDGPGEIRMDRQELSQAGWYRREDLLAKTWRPDHVSLTGHMIRLFLEGKEP